MIVKQEDRKDLKKAVLISELESAITGRKAEETTVPRYLEIFRRFLDFVKTQKYLSQEPPFGKVHIDAFLTYLKKQGSHGTHLRWVYFALRGIFNELRWPWPYDEHKKDAPRASEAHRPYFDEEEILTFLEAVIKHGDLRDIALMFVAASCHPARIQLRNMNRSDYNRETKRLHISPRLKGDLPGDPLLPKGAWENLEEYVDSRTDESDVLFLSERGGRLSVTQLTRLFEKYLKRSELPTDQRHGFHSFRRAMATIHHDGGMSEKEIQTVGRWKTPTMPHLYIQLKPKKLERKRIRTHPLFTQEEKNG